MTEVERERERERKRERERERGRERERERARERERERGREREKEKEIYTHPLFALWPSPCASLVAFRSFIIWKRVVVDSHPWIRVYSPTSQHNLHRFVKFRNV